MVDLKELASRVEAAQREYRDKSEQQGKLVLRLNDLAVIVEGSLARQRQALENAESKLRKLTNDNEQMRSMILTLLNLVEGRSLDSLPQIMLRMERSVKDLMAGQTQGQGQNAQPVMPPVQQTQAPLQQSAPYETPAASPHAAPVSASANTAQQSPVISDAALENLRAMTQFDPMLIEPGDEEGRTPPQKIDTSPAAAGMQSLTSLVSRLGMSVNSVVPLRRQG